MRTGISRRLVPTCSRLIASLIRDKEKETTAREEGGGGERGKQIDSLASREVRITERFTTPIF